MELPAPTCKAKYRWTRLELQRAMQHHHRLKQGRGVLWLAQVFSVILLSFIAIVLIGWLLLGSPPSPPWSLTLVVAFCLFLLTFDKLFAWQAGLGFEKRPDANTEIAWEFSNDKITSLTGLGTAEVSWKSFLKVVETNDGFLFYPLKNLFHWIPLTAFSSTDCVEQIRTLIREHGIVLVDKRSKR